MSSVRILVVSILVLAWFCVGQAVAIPRARVSAQDTIARTLTIDKVVVSAKRKQYKKKGNPAVDLARILIERRAKGDPFKATNLLVTKHEKTVVSIDNFKTIDSTASLAYLNKNIVVNDITGRTMLPISLRERVVSVSSHNGERHETQITAQNYGLDEQLDNQSVSNFLAAAIKPLDIFTDYVSLMQRYFLSPLALGAPGMYKYYLAADTVVINGARCVKLGFFPYNKNGSNLSGTLYVRADSSYFVERTQITVPSTADINYVNHLSANIDYRLDSMGNRLVENEDLDICFSVAPTIDAINVRHSISYVGYDFLSRENPSIEPLEARDSIVAAQQIAGVKNVTQVMRGNVWFRIAEQLAILASQGYLGTGRESKFDIGPIFNFLSGNELEGTRLSFGGMTTPKLLKRLFFEGYVAYGTRDDRWKYGLAAEWSFVDRKTHLREFPVHSLRLSYIDDVHKFGTPLGSQAAGNVFSWLQRAPDSALTYIRELDLTYTHEFASKFSFAISARHYTQNASAVMSFTPDVDHYSMSELGVRLRYAPGEAIFQTHRRRYNMELFSPEIELYHKSSVKGLLNTDYTSHRTELWVRNRFNIKPLGHIDLQLRLGSQWSVVPYMLLPHPATNLSYLVSDGKLALMHPLEYMYDRFVQWDLSYYLDGLILSHIPGVNKLKLREVITFRGLWGTLTDKNNPFVNSNLPMLPSGSRPIGQEPYMEIGVGLDNILSMFRIEYVWRLTYLDKFETPRGGILVGATFKF